MPRLFLDVEADDFARLGVLSKKQNVSVEDFVLRNALSAAAADGVVLNPSHRRHVVEATRPQSDYGSARDMMHDRKRGRAEAYLRARENLLELIDKSEADIGPLGWSRARVYEP